MAFRSQYKALRVSAGEPYTNFKNFEKNWDFKKVSAAQLFTHVHGLSTGEMFSLIQVFRSFNLKRKEKPV